MSRYQHMYSRTYKCLTERGSIIHVDKVCWSPQEPLRVFLKWRKNLSTGGRYHLALDPFDNSRDDRSDTGREVSGNERSQLDKFIKALAKHFKCKPPVRFGIGSLSLIDASRSLPYNGKLRGRYDGEAGSRPVAVPEGAVSNQRRN